MEFASLGALAWQLGFTSLFIFTKHLLALHIRTVGIHPTFLINVLAVLFLQSTSVMTMLLNEMIDLHYSHAEISIIPPANATPAVINTVAPHSPCIQMQVGASFPLQSWVLGPVLPYDHSSSSANLLITLNKAFVQQLISNSLFTLALLFELLRTGAVFMLM